MAQFKTPTVKWLCGGSGTDTARLMMAEFC